MQQVLRNFFLAAGFMLSLPVVAQDKQKLYVPDEFCYAGNTPYRAKCGIKNLQPK
jgi:hypothetical protein